MPATFFTLVTDRSEGLTHNVVIDRFLVVLVVLVVLAKPVWLCVCSAVLAVGLFYRH